MITRWIVAVFVILILVPWNCLARRARPMNEHIPFKSAHELRKLQTAASTGIVPREMAYTLPVPKKTESGMVIVVLYYYETGPMNHRTVHMPERAMLMNPVSGEVLRFDAIRPADVGIREPLTPVPGAGITPGMTGDEYFAFRQRFLDISAQVWEAYDSGKTEFNATTKAILREYESLFLCITKKEIAPFYVMTSPQFFKWLKNINKI